MFAQCLLDVCSIVKTPYNSTVDIHTFLPSASPGSGRSGPIRFLVGCWWYDC